MGAKVLLLEHCSLISAECEEREREGELLRPAEEDERQSRAEGGDQTRETKPEAGDREALLGFRGIQAKEQAVADRRC